LAVGRAPSSIPHFCSDSELHCAAESDETAEAHRTRNNFDQTFDEAVRPLVSESNLWMCLVLSLILWLVWC
jgi:hypothetical protein